MLNKVENQFYRIKNRKEDGLKIMYNRIISGMLDHNIDMKSQEDILYELHERLFRDYDDDE